jgi:dTDP-4-dehydrorhamnose reductase
VRWLVTGASGLLGREIVSRLRASGAEVRAAGRTELDVRDERAVAEAVEGVDVVLGCAAWTKVDEAEAHEPEAFSVNATGAAVLARAANRAGARLLHVSTDYVFSGDASEPYREEDEPSPVSAYGRSKAAGEKAVLEEGHLVVRTAWLYGAHGPCFPRTIARLVRERGGVRVVADQVGQPTWAADVARVLVDLARTEAPAGIYHATSAGRTTWHGFALAVVAAAGLDPGVVEPCTTAEMPRPAPRPAWSVLGCEALARVGVEAIGPWEERWAEAAAAVLDKADTTV